MRGSKNAGGGAAGGEETSRAASCKKAGGLVPGQRGEGGWKLEVLGARGFLCARHPLLVAEGQLPPGAVAPAVAHDAGRPAGRACPDTAGSGFGLVHVLRLGFGGGTAFPTPKFSSTHGRCVN